MDSDNECVKCGGYSGGASLCLVCEKTAVKRNAKKPRRKKLDPLCAEMLDPLCAEMLELLKGIQVNAVSSDDIFEDDGKLARLVKRVEARFKV